MWFTKLMSYLSLPQISERSLNQVMVRGSEPDSSASILTVFPSESIRDSGGFRVKVGALLCSVHEGENQDTVLDENSSKLEMSTRNVASEITHF